MPKNPIVHALAASAYIVMLVLGINALARPNTPDTIFIPVAMLSLFVLSAAVMGYLFLGQPLRLYFDGKKVEAVRFFGFTVLAFACLTLAAVAAMWFTMP